MNPLEGGQITDPPLEAHVGGVADPVDRGDSQLGEVGAEANRPTTSSGRTPSLRIKDPLSSQTHGSHPTTLISRT